MDTQQVMEGQPYRRLPMQECRNQDRPHPIFLLSNAMGNPLFLPIRQDELQEQRMANNGNLCLHLGRRWGLHIHRGPALLRRAFQAWEPRSPVHPTRDRVRSRWLRTTRRCPCLQLLAQPTHQGLEAPLPAMVGTISKHRRNCPVRMEIHWNSARMLWAKVRKQKEIVALQQ